MAICHFHVGKVIKHKTTGGAVGLAQYIARDNLQDAQQQRRYLARKGHEKDDLVAWGAGSLPRWARDDQHFWAMADAKERQNGVVAWTYQVSLPRELSEQGRLALATDILATYFARYPHSWAVHSPPAHDGSGDNPHLHVMVSARREDTPSDCLPTLWFRRAAPPGLPEMSGGVRKDRTWSWQGTPEQMRAGMAVLINAALEREGQEVAISPLTLIAQGHDRQVLSYDSLYRDHGKEAQAIQAQRTRQLAGHREWENACAINAWHKQKAQEQLWDVHDRQAVIDHVRDRFWRHDTSPAREQEREESLARALAREWERTGDEALRVYRMQERIRTPQQGQEQTQLPDMHVHRPYGRWQATIWESEQEWKRG